MCMSWFDCSCLDSDMPVAIMVYLSHMAQSDIYAKYPVRTFCITCSAKSKNARSFSMEDRLGKLEEAVNKISAGFAAISATTNTSVQNVKTKVVSSTTTTSTTRTSASIAEKVKKALQQQQEGEVR